MKKATKILASVLAIILALSTASMAAFAAEPDQTIKIAKEYSQDFVLTIPDGTQDLAEGQSFTVSAYAFLEYGKELAVSVTSENTWQLADSKYTENSKGIAYEMMCDGTVLTAKTEEVLAVPYNAQNHTGEAALLVKSIASPEYAGTYEDFLTFTTSVRTATSAENPAPEAEQTAQVIVAPDSSMASVDFYNSEDNEGKYLTFEIRLEDESEQGYEVLYTSGLVDPGYHIKNISLSRGFDEGIYDAIVHIQVYNMDDTLSCGDGLVITDGSTLVDGGIDIPIKILVEASAYSSAKLPIAVTATIQKFPHNGGAN